METLASVVIAFAICLDTLFVAEAFAVLGKKFSGLGILDLMKSLATSAPQGVNGLPEFMRRAMDGDCEKKLRELAQRFTVPLIMFNNGGTVSSMFLIALFSWMRLGRRVYSLDADLARVLLTTSPAAFTWNELDFPFDTFIIKLDTPLMQGEGDSPGGKASTIIVMRMSIDEQRMIGAKNPLGSVVSVLVLPDHVGTYVPITDAERREWLSRIRVMRQNDTKPVKSALEYLMGRSRLLAERGGDLVYMVNIGQDVACQGIEGMILNTMGGWEDRDHVIGPQQSADFLSQACALVANFLIFLKTAHHTRRAKGSESEWVRKPFTGKPAPGEIVTDAQIFKVLHSFKLTTELREAMDAVIRNPSDRDYMLRTGFRCAHWRRPPGKGHIPDAEKTVLVSMTILNPTNRAPGTLPGGAVAKLR